MYSQDFLTGQNRSCVVWAVDDADAGWQMARKEAAVSCANRQTRGSRHGQIEYGTCQMRFSVRTGVLPWSRMELKLAGGREESGLEKFIAANRKDKVTIIP